MATIRFSVPGLIATEKLCLNTDDFDNQQSVYGIRVSRYSLGLFLNTFRTFARDYEITVECFGHDPVTISDYRNQNGDWDCDFYQLFDQIKEAVS